MDWKNIILMGLILIFFYIFFIPTFHEGLSKKRKKKLARHSVNIALNKINNLNKDIEKLNSNLIDKLRKTARDKNLPWNQTSRWNRTSRRNRMSRQPLKPTAIKRNRR